MAEDLESICFIGVFFVCECLNTKHKRCKKNLKKTNRQTGQMLFFYDTKVFCDCAEKLRADAGQADAASGDSGVP